MGYDVLHAAQPPSFGDVYSFIGGMLHFGEEKNPLAILALGIRNHWHQA